jgi:hypothetical protein
MDLDSYFVEIFFVVRETLSRTCAIAAGAIGIAVNAVIVEVHHSSERKAKHGTGEDEPEDEVVAFGETDGVIDFAGLGNETVGGRACGDYHGEEWRTAISWEVAVVWIREDELLME